MGWTDAESQQELLLVEAKAHVDELMSWCKATNPSSAELIARSFEETKKALGVSGSRDWFGPYYQYCNRIAATWFLHQRGVKTHLLSIYFVGDTPSSRRHCPQAEEEWREPLTRQAGHVGLPLGHSLTDWMHTLILNTDPGVAGQRNMKEQL